MTVPGSSGAGRSVRNENIGQKPVDHRGRRGLVINNDVNNGVVDALHSGEDLDPLVLPKDQTLRPLISRTERSLLTKEPVVAPSERAPCDKADR